MQLRKFITTLIALAGIAAFAPQASAQVSPNFERLNPPQPVEGGGKVEVTEFFWYGCPHCYAMEPFINSWLKGKPADVVFKRVPTYNESWAPMVTLYYTLEAMGVVEQYHQKVFDAIHKDHVNLNNKGKRDEWLKANGIDPASTPRSRSPSPSPPRSSARSSSRRRTRWMACRASS
jgi:thiol:disulfide interchange protein DsbA